MAAPSEQLDNTIRIVTPENIAFQYRVAGPFRRLTAYIVDLALRTGAFIVLAIAAMIAFSVIGLPGVGLAVTLVALFLLEWFYGGLFETFWNGQTPGKRAVSIRVLSADGQPINAVQAVLRNILRAVDLQPIIFGQLGLWAAAMNDRSQRLGDLACGTMVVVDEPGWLHGVARIQEPAALALAEQLPPAFRPSPTLARAVAAYVSRRQYIAFPRLIEIAQHLAVPLAEHLKLPRATHPDHLLCAVYHRAFVADRGPANSPGAPPSSPFAPPQPEPPVLPSAGSPSPVAKSAVPAP